MREEYKALCEAVERKAGRAMTSPVAFEWLRAEIFRMTRRYISVSTLMRLWGYRADVAPRWTTLDGVARYLGFADFTTFCRHGGEEATSGIVLSHRVESEADLQVGDRLLLRWLPDRTCEIVYLGEKHFRVTSSDNTRLASGDTFDCALFIEGEPLFLDNAVLGGGAPVTYVCGRNGGVRIENVEELEGGVNA